MLIYEILERIICTSSTQSLHALQTIPFSGVGGSGRKPIQSADPATAGFGVGVGGKCKISKV